MRVDPKSFDAVYGTAGDPWAFATSAYELDKYDTTVANLAKEHYTRCFEPACSIGVLTSRLAACADQVVACDASAHAIEGAGKRLGPRSNVELVAASIPEWWPTGLFDLIVLSELGYYWDVDGWHDIIGRCRRSLRHGGEVLAVHWLGSSPDHILDGTTVHRELQHTLGPPDKHLERCAYPDTERTAAGFLLDRWTGVARD